MEKLDLINHRHEPNSTSSQETPRDNLFLPGKEHIMSKADNGTLSKRYIHQIPA